MVFDVVIFDEVIIPLEAEKLISYYTQIHMTLIMTTLFGRHTIRLSPNGLKVTKIDIEV